VQPYGETQEKVATFRLHLDVFDRLVDTYNVRPSCCGVTLIHLIDLHVPSCLTFTQVELTQFPEVPKTAVVMFWPKSMFVCAANKRELCSNFCHCVRTVYTRIPLSLEQNGSAMRGNVQIKGIVHPKMNITP